MALPPIPFRVTQASLNQTAFDFPRNTRNIFAAIDEAVKQHSDLLTLEELTLTGYDAGDDFQKSDNRLTAELLQGIARYAYAKDPNLLISIGHPWFLAWKDVPAVPGAESERRKQALYNRINLPFNAQSFLGHGRILGMTAKNYLFNYERGYEKRYFAEWSAEEANRVGGIFGTLSVPVPGQSEEVPFGRPVLHLNGEAGDVNLAHIICEEKWIASRHDDGDGRDYGRDAAVPALAQQLGTPGLIVVMPDASPPAPLKIHKHIHLVKRASQYADAVVNTDGLGSSGSSFAQFGHQLIAQKGELISYGTRLSFARGKATSRTFFVSPADARLAAHTHLSIPHAFAAPDYLKIPKPVFEEKSWDHPDHPDLRTEETMRMTCLWLFDYMRKTKSQGVVEALSGGMDSAFNTVVVAAMVRLAVDELGVDGFCREMRHLRYGPEMMAEWKAHGTEAAIGTCLKHMLTTVYMGTNNSSEATREAARFLIEGGERDGKQIKGIGGIFKERNVQELIDFYAATYAIENTGALEAASRDATLKELAAHFNMRPGELAPDALAAKVAEIKARHPEIAADMVSAADPRNAIAYENVQARARQALIMLFANAEGKMAIANPNLDEARNSYATYGGDLHSGTVNPNGFLNKEEEIRIMQHLAVQGLHGIGAFPSLQAALANRPTAELQPKDAEGNVTQHDEDALERSFAQMNRISRVMLGEHAGQHAERRLNPGEVYEACAGEALFKNSTPADMYNMLRVSYTQWGMSQFKIHASPITPTFGDNVDHQASLRTPNLSGQDRAQLTQLGVRLLFKMAQEECGARSLAWNPGEEAAWQSRALLDEEFVDRFEGALRAGGVKGRSFNLDMLYAKTRERGLETVFGPVPPLYRFLSTPHADYHVA